MHPSFNLDLPAIDWSAAGAPGTSPIGTFHPGIISRRDSYLRLYQQIDYYFRLWHQPCPPVVGDIDQATRKLAQDTASSVRSTFPTHAYTPKNQAGTTANLLAWVLAWENRSVSLYDASLQLLQSWSKPTPSQSSRASRKVGLEKLEEIKGLMRRFENTLPGKIDGLETLEKVAQLLTTVGSNFASQIERQLGAKRLTEGPKTIVRLGLGSHLGDLQKLPQELRDMIFDLAMVPEIKLREMHSFHGSEAVLATVTLENVPNPTILRLSKQLSQECLWHAAAHTKITVSDEGRGHNVALSVPPVLKFRPFRDHKDRLTHRDRVTFRTLLHCSPTRQHSGVPDSTKCWAVFEVYRQAAMIEDIRKQLPDHTEATVNVRFCDCTRSGKLGTTSTCEAFVFSKLHTFRSRQGNTRVRMFRRISRQDVPIQPEVFLSERQFHRD